MYLFQQKINNVFWNFSEFQVSVAQEIAARPDFYKFVTVDMGVVEQVEHPRKRGPYNMLWYDTTLRLHVWNVGVKRIIRQV